MFISAVSYLKSKRDELNELNVFPVPDGDTGDNMYATAEGGLLAISPGDSTPLCDVLSAIKSGMLLGARGNSGVILSQFFAGIADGLSGISRADAVLIAGVALPQSAQHKRAQRVITIGFVNMFLFSFISIFFLISFLKRP